VIKEKIADLHILQLHILQRQIILIYM